MTKMYDLWLMFQKSCQKRVYAPVFPYFPTGAIEKIYRYTRKESVVIIRIFVFAEKDGGKIQSDGHGEK